MDGLTFTKKVRTDPNSPNPYVPIIMLTGHTETARVMEARDAGINMFLAKPISVKALSERLALMIDNPARFVRTPTYFGPDRRRKDVGPPKGMPERRKSNPSDWRG
jgi:DNA-binding response OmpR family regulator